jgi:putative membrane protein
MSILSIIKKDFSANWRNKIRLLCLAVAVLLPLAYGFLYLWAFWNPYDHMQSVPVAVVNEDQGAIRDKKPVNYGQQIVDEIKDNKTLDWQFVPYQEAAGGLNEQKYYAIIRIPADFSSDLVSADSDSPLQAQIDWQTLDSTSYLFTNYFKNVIAALSKDINAKILPDFTAEADKQKIQLIGDLDNAGNGAKNLESGLKTLHSGTKTLGDNLSKAKNGGEDLTDGLKTLNSKSADLATGVAQAQSGAASLATGLSSAQSGATDLADGLDTLKNGASTLANGTGQAYTGSQQLASGANQIYSQLYQTDQDLSPFYPNLAKASGQIDQYNSQSTTTIPNYISYAQNQKTQLLDGEKKLANGNQTLASNLSTINSGANSLATGLNSARQGANSLNSGLSQLSSGSNDLSDGLTQLYSGTSQFGQGVSEAYAGSSNLTNGLGQLATGTKQLIGGFADAQNGAATPSNKIFKGADELQKKIKHDKVSSLINIINEPVKFNDVSTATNTIYGAGLAPYFLSLALWMGALISTLLIPTKDSRLNLSYVSRTGITLGKFILLAAIGVAQATALYVSVVFGLGLKVEYPGYFWLFCVITSLCFMTIMQFLTYFFDKVGELIGMLFLMLQLTSSSGTFPVQSSARFFYFLSPLVPMSYSIRGLRLLILGGNTNLIIAQFLILAGMALSFLVIKIIFTKRTVAISDIYPLIEL